MKRSFAIAAVLAALTSPAMAGSEETPPPPTPKPGEEVSEDFFRFIDPKMSFDCERAIKRFVKYDIRSPGVLWGTNSGDSALLRFSRWSKRVALDNTILLAGDEAEAQNGFGNWVRINYTCTIDLANKTVKRATLDNGRLP